MLWVCSNVKIDWNAISAVGTSAAALIALALWSIDRFDKYLRLRADGRLAAQLVYTETIPMLSNLAIMKERLHASEHEGQYERDVELVGNLADHLAFFKKMTPRLRSERLERMLESNTSLTPELSEAVADMLGAIRVTVEITLIIFRMEKVTAYNHLDELRASFEDTHEAMRRAQKIANSRSREGRVSSFEMQQRMKKAVLARKATEQGESELFREQS